MVEEADCKGQYTTHLEKLEERLLFVIILVIEPRAMCMLGKHYTIKIYPLVSRTAKVLVYRNAGVTSGCGCACVHRATDQKAKTKHRNL